MHFTVSLDEKWREGLAQDKADRIGHPKNQCCVASLLVPKPILANLQMQKKDTALSGGYSM